MESQLPEFRRRVVTSVGHLAAVAPETANKLVRSGLTAYLTRRRTSLSKSQTSSTDNEKSAIRTQPRLLAFLSASTAFGKDEDNAALREKLLSKTIVLAHHPEICKCDQLADPKPSEVMVIILGGNSRQVWIELCRKAHLDPHAVTENQLDNLLNAVITLSQETGVIEMLSLLHGTHFLTRQTLLITLRLAIPP